MCAADLDPLPTHEALARAPELAPIALLQRALDVTCHALIAANPEMNACLDDAPHGPPCDAQVRCTFALIALADRLQASLHTYVRLLAEADAAQRADDIDF